MTQNEKKNERRLAVSILGEFDENLARNLISDLIRRGGHVYDCRITPLGTQLSITLLVGGNWSTLGKLETALPSMAEKFSVSIQFRNTVSSTPDIKTCRPYAVELIAPSQADLLPQVLAFFHHHEAIVHDLAAQEYESAHTGATLCNLTMAAYIPVSHRPQAIREAYMDLCDELNADGIFDPIKT